MSNKKKKLLILLAVLAIISIGMIIAQTRVFKPSLGSRMARLAVQYWLAPAFAADDFVQSVRKSLVSINRLAILPHRTRVEKVTVEGMRAEWVTADSIDRQSKRVILYIHGGGFFSGSCDTHRDLVARISGAAGLPVLMPEYRLAPEHRFPAANEDCLAAYRWLLRQGYTAKDIFIGGDSAGGCLTLMTVISLRDAGQQLPAAIFLLSPLTDAVHFDGESLKTRALADPFFRSPELMDHRSHELMDRHIGLYTRELKIKPPILSPVRLNLGGLPPMLIQVGGDEILLSDSTRLAERAKKAGVDTTIQVWEHMWHVFQSFAVIAPESREAIRSIGDFVKRQSK